jgi:hypothetical protein
MKTRETKDYIQFSSSDAHGRFIVRVYKATTAKIKIQSKNGEAGCFIKVGLHGLIEIRNCLNKVITFLERK